MGFFRNSMLGMMAGGLYGGAGGGGWEGAAGGAAAGGLAGGYGFSTARKMARGAGFTAGKLGKGVTRRNVAGMFAGGVERGARGITAAASTLGNRTIFDQTMKMRGVADKAAGFIGKNAVGINKYGGVALGVMGTASAAHIGSSVLSSNRGY